MKKYILLFLFILTIAACRPISRGPNPYQAPSPLAMSMESPLYARGEAIAIDMPDGLIAPDDYRAGTIPAAAMTPMRYKLYWPLFAGHQTYPCYTNAMAAELLRLMITDRVQQRKSPRCNELVTKVAQMRADDMVEKGYFSHRDKNGHGANFYLAQVGCLPSWYPQDGNSVESITLNYHTPQAAWNALVSSRGHRPHVLGMHPFFASQVAIGVGYAESGWGKVYVVVTTEGCE
jgi:hypothetical protein